MSQPQYDVFLSYHSTDADAARVLAQNLNKHGVRPFLRERDILPGRPRVEAIQAALQQSEACAILIGPEGIGALGRLVLQTALNIHVHRKSFPVIPVLLPGAESTENVYTFLHGLEEVDFRSGLDDESTFIRFLSGIQSTEILSSGLRREDEIRLANSVCGCAGLKDPQKRIGILSSLPFRSRFEVEGGYWAENDQIVAVCLEETHRFGSLVYAMLPHENIESLSTGPCALLQKLFPQPVAWAEVLRLKKTLEGINVPDNTARQIYRDIMPMGPPPGSGSTNATFLECLDLLVARNVKAVIEYVLNCLNSIGAEPNPPLLAVLSGICRCQGLNLAEVQGSLRTPPNDPSVASAATLQVKIQRNDFAGSGYLVDAWLCEDGIITPFETRECSMDSLQELLPRFVSAAHLYLWPSSADVCIEVALPLELLECDLDRWTIEVGTEVKPLGTHYQVIVRSYERIYDPKWAGVKSDWDKRWKAKPSVGPVADKYVCWSKGESEFDCCLSDEQSILVALAPFGDSCRKSLGRILSNGVPIAFWPRYSHKNAAMTQSTLREVVCCPELNRLPRRVFDRRRCVQPDDTRCLWESMVLLWDDPENLPPDAPKRSSSNMIRLQSPEE